MLGWIRCVFHRKSIRAIARRVAGKCMTALLQCQAQHADWEQRELYAEALLHVRRDWDKSKAHDVVQSAESEQYGSRFRFLDVVRHVAVTECIGFVIARYGVEHLNEHRDDIAAVALDECAKIVPLEL